MRTASLNAIAPPPRPHASPALPLLVLCSSRASRTPGDAAAAMAVPRDTTEGMRDAVLYRLLPGMWLVLAVVMFIKGNLFLAVLFVALAVLPPMATRRARAERRARTPKRHDGV